MGQTFNSFFSSAKLDPNSETSEGNESGIENISNIGIERKTRRKKNIKRKRLTPQSKGVKDVPPLPKTPYQEATMDNDYSANESESGEYLRLLFLLSFEF